MLKKLKTLNKLKEKFLNQKNSFQKSLMRSSLVKKSLKCASLAKRSFIQRGFEQRKFGQRCLAQRGSTIIELLIALMIVGLVVTAIAVLGSYSIKNTGEARFKQVATTLAQEVIEKSRAEKNRLGFVNFKNTVGASTYCFNTIPATFSSSALAPLQGTCSGTFALTGASFTREVVFSNSLSDIVEVQSTVSWNDGSNTRNVVLTQKFKQANF